MPKSTHGWVWYLLWELFLYLRFQYKCRRKSNGKFLQFKLLRKCDTKINMLQKSFSTNLYWFDLSKSAKLFSTQQSLWNWPFWFSSTHCECIENEFSSTEASIAYRDYKEIDNNAFRHDIKKCNFNTADLKTSKETVFCILNKHAPMKRKYVCGNEAPFMMKELITQSWNNQG